MKLDRRDFILAAAALGAASASGLSLAADAKAAIELPKLPWEPNALEPVISSRTVGVHYGKHHKGYLDNLNKLLVGNPLEGRSLEEVVRETAGKADKVGIFNNAAQTWNHTFYWQSLSPKGGGKPGAELSGMIDSAFGSFEEFRKAFLAAALSQFGSGWAWLVADKASKKLALVKTGNADTPLSNPAVVPLAVLDVWEHAYYLKYQNKRPDYIAAFYNVIDWDEVARRYVAALA